MDTKAIPGDAIEYIKELQKTVKMYEDELRDIEEDCKEYSVDRDNQPVAEFNKNPSNAKADESTQAMVEIEVNQIGAMDFLVRVIYKQKQGGLSRLMQAMNSIGLQVIDVNVTTSNGSALNILREKGKEIKPNALKESLSKTVLSNGAMVWRFLQPPIYAQWRRYDF